MGSIGKSNTCGFVTTIAYDKLKAENEKLRKLVLCLLTCASYDCLCDSCPLNGGPGIWEFEDFCDGLLDLVHELRIEVR